MSGQRDFELSMATGAIKMFTPERPMLLTRSQHEDAMKIPEIAALADRLMVSPVLPCFGTVINRIGVIILCVPTEAEL